jgi:hypothetical protein
MLNAKFLRNSKHLSGILTTTTPAVLTYDEPVYSNIYKYLRLNSVSLIVILRTDLDHIHIIRLIFKYLFTKLMSVSKLIEFILYSQHTCNRKRILRLTFVFNDLHRCVLSNRTELKICWAHHVFVVNTWTPLIELRTARVNLRYLWHIYQKFYLINNDIYHFNFYLTYRFDFLSVIHILHLI